MLHTHSHTPDTFPTYSSLIFYLSIPKPSFAFLDLRSKKVGDGKNWLIVLVINRDSCPYLPYVSYCLISQLVGIRSEFWKSQVVEKTLGYHSIWVRSCLTAQILACPSLCIKISIIEYWLFQFGPKVNFCDPL